MLMAAALYAAVVASFFIQSFEWSFVERIGVLILANSFVILSYLRKGESHDPQR